MERRNDGSDHRDDPIASPPRSLIDKALAAQDIPEGQRRRATVLFTDMADFTPLAERVGEEKTYLLMRRVIKEMSEAVHAHQGTVQELTGDGLMALFGVPVAIEDAPVRACGAALDIQKRMVELEDELEGEYGVRPKFRVGIHTGPLVVGKIGDDLRVEFTALGDTVNLASRLEGQAEPGTILISDATNRLVEGYVESSFAGARDIKGKSERQRVFRLERLRSDVTRFDVAVGRGLTPVVGRHTELETLLGCWHEAQQGVLRIVNVVGDPGIGKSRLVHEFHQHVGGDAILLQGHCTPGGQATPFHPFIEVVRDSFRIGHRDAPEEIESKLRRGLEILGLETAQNLPYMLNLLGQRFEDGAIDRLASEVVGIRTRHALSAVLRERCRLSSVVMFIEDVHWIDTASEEWMRGVGDGDRDLPLLIICGYRPHYRPPWVDNPGLTVLSLDRLSDDGTVALLKGRLGVDDLPNQLTRLVVEKAQGNPLFAEEIANYLLEKGRIQKSGGGVSYEPGENGEDLPMTLENLLMERFDRLEPGSRSVLEAASVIGPRFSTDIVDAVVGMNGSTGAHLLDLERQELIFREPEGDAYRFKHALVQDAIYNSLLTPSRAALHESVAVAIEGSRSASLSEFVDILADHYSHTPRAEKTAHYMALAGARSLQVYSLDEAGLRFRRVIELVEEVPGCADDAFLADVLMKMARVNYYRADFKNIIALVEPYLGRMEALGDKRRLSRLLFEVGYAHVFSAGGATGKDYLERALALGEELVDDESIGYACLGLMFYYLFWSEPSADNRSTFIALGDRVMAIAEKSGDVWLAAKCLNCRWGEATFFSRFAEARDLCEELFELSRENNDPRPMGFGLWQMAIINLHNDQYQEAIENADACLDIALSPLDRLSARSAKGGAYALTGRAQEGFEILGDIRQQSEELGFVALIMMIDVFYGASMGLAGNLGAGIGWIKDSIKRSEAWGNHNMPALAHLVLGEIYLQMAKGEEMPPLSVILKNLGFVLTNLPVAALKSRRHFEAAIRMSRKVDMPGHLARSLLGLGLLHKAKKRAPQARACLEEAREIAETVRADNIVEKVHAALISL